MLNVESNHDIHWGEYNRKDCLGTIWVLVISQFLEEIDNLVLEWGYNTRIKKGMARSATWHHRTRTRTFITPTATYSQLLHTKAKSQFKR